MKVLASEDPGDPLPSSPPRDEPNPTDTPPPFFTPTPSITPSSGTVSRENTLDLMVRFDASGLTAGTYTAIIDNQSNDPDEGLVTVSVTFTVQEGYE